MGRFSLVLGVLGVAWAAATPAPQSTQAPTQPVFRAGVDHVDLDVVVTDTHDKPVKNLTKADFVITEHGRAQTIADFQFLSVPPSHRAVPDVKASIPTVDVVTNTHPPLGRQWVLVIDDLHIIEQHIVHTKKVIQEFLEVLSPDDQVAIVFVGRSDLSQDFTSDLGAQMRTVNRIRAALGFAYDAADASQVGGTSAIAGGVGQRERHRYAGATTDVLKNVCAALVRSTYPRKAVVYVSEGMTYRWDDMSDFFESDVFEQLKATFEAARRAGVPVYPIDPRGIPDCTSVRGECSSPPWPNINAQFNNMRTLAENTDGLAFVNRPNMTAAVQELVDDNSSFYLLGYYPEPFERDGKFHDVKVTVTRPGVRVRARAGYAAPKATASTAAETRQTLDDALGAALPVGGLSLRAFAAPVVASAHGMTTVVTLEVTYPAILERGKIDDTLQFGMLALDHEGKVKGSTRRAFHFVASSMGTGAEMRYTINDTIDLPSQPLTLRVGVASQALGTAATIHLPVEVIGPSHDQLQMSAVVLGFAGPTRQTAVPPGALKDLVPFQPTTSRTFADSDTLQMFVPLFWASKDPSASVTLAVRRGDDLVLERHAQVSGVLGSGGHRRAALTMSLPLAGVPAADYVLEVVARLANGQTATRDVAVTLR